LHLHGMGPVDVRSFRWRCSSRGGIASRELRAAGVKSPQVGGLEPRGSGFRSGIRQARAFRLQRYFTCGPHRDVRAPRPNAGLVAQAGGKLSGTTIQRGSSSCRQICRQCIGGRCSRGVLPNALPRSHATSELRMLSSDVSAKTFAMECRGFTTRSNLEAPIPPRPWVMARAHVSNWSAIGICAHDRARTVVSRQSRLAPPNPLDFRRARGSKDPIRRASLPCTRRTSAKALWMDMGGWKMFALQRQRGGATESESVCSNIRASAQTVASSMSARHLEQADAVGGMRAGCSTLCTRMI